MAHQLAGAQAFQLHDTYGFPIDLTVEMAAEQGLQVDTEGFRSLMKEQRERAKADARAKKAGHADTSGYRELREKGVTEFTGYQELATDSQVRGAAAGRRGRARPPSRARPSRSCSRRPRSTRSPVVRSPTRA